MPKGLVIFLIVIVLVGVVAGILVWKMMQKQEPNTIPIDDLHVAIAEKKETRALVALKDRDTQEILDGYFSVYWVEYIDNESLRHKLNEGRLTKGSFTVVPLQPSAENRIFAWSDNHYQSMTYLLSATPNATTLVEITTAKYGTLSLINNPSLIGDNLTLKISSKGYFRRAIACAGKSVGISSILMPSGRQRSIPSNYASKADLCWEIDSITFDNNEQEIDLAIGKNSNFNCERDFLDVYFIDKELRRDTETELLTELNGEDYGSPDHHFRVEC